MEEPRADDMQHMMQHMTTKIREARRPRTTVCVRCIELGLTTDAVVWFDGMGACEVHERELQLHAIEMTSGDSLRSSRHDIKIGD